MLFSGASRPIEKTKNLQNLPTLLENDFLVGALVKYFFMRPSATLTRTANVFSGGGGEKVSGQHENTNFCIFWCERETKAFEITPIT